MAKQRQLAPGGRLTPRQETILELIIREFVATAEPVGSKRLVEAYGLDVSPATVRNEMKRLEQMGYLSHPHTSAGRVPTHQGYRYFVQHLLPEASLPSTVRRTIRHQFFQVQSEMDQWMQLSASVLARTAHSAAIATAPRAEHTRFKHLELISLQSHTVLMVLVLEGGSVRQQIIALEEPRSQSELSQISNRLNDVLAGLNWMDIQRTEAEQDVLARRVVDLVADTLFHEDERVDEVYHEGLVYMLRSPEFSDQDATRQVVEIFENPIILGPFLAEARQMPGVQVILGGENPYEHLPDVSLVLSRYGRPNYGAGVVGVIGPLRMPYAQTISVVRFISQLMTGLLSELYGYPEPPAGTEGALPQGESDASEEASRPES
jgi:heat-inducible transcriptional repressor